mgnify:CR=1 FL=1
MPLHRKHMYVLYMSVYIYILCCIAWAHMYVLYCIPCLFTYVLYILDVWHVYMYLCVMRMKPLKVMDVIKNMHIYLHTEL